MKVIQFLPDIMIPLRSEGFEVSFWMNLLAFYLGEKLKVGARETAESSVPWEFPGTTTHGITHHLEP